MSIYFCYLIGRKPLRRTAPKAKQFPEPQSASLNTVLGESHVRDLHVVLTSGRMRYGSDSETAAATPTHRLSV